MDQLLSDSLIFLRESGANALISCSCLLRCPAVLRSRTTSPSGLYKWPNWCHLKPFSSLCRWPQNLEVGRFKYASRGHNQCKELVDLVEPSHKRRQVRLYVPRRHLSESIHHPRWYHGKWHTHAWPQERSGCLNYIQLFSETSHSLAEKKGLDILNMIERTFPRTKCDGFEQLYAAYSVQRIFVELYVSNIDSQSNQEDNFKVHDTIKKTTFKKIK